MDTEFSGNPIGVEGFAQNGSAGCATACMANVARILSHENLTPDTVDAELKRQPVEDITGYDRDFRDWNNGVCHKELAYNCWKSSQGEPVVDTYSPTPFFGQLVSYRAREIPGIDMRQLAIVSA